MTDKTETVLTDADWAHADSDLFVEIIDGQFVSKAASIGSALRVVIIDNLYDFVHQ